MSRDRDEELTGPPCMFCGRPMPRRRWWQLIAGPPFHDLANDPACMRVLRRRLGVQ